MENVENNVVNTEKTYTQQEVDALLQSESDKRVSQALKKQQAKFEKERSLSSLDEGERMKAENADRIAELEQQLAELQAERNKSEMRNALTARGLSPDFAEIISMGESVEEAQANIEALDKLIKTAVKTEIEKRLSSNTAPKGNSNPNGAFNIKNMSLSQLQAHMNGGK